MRVFEGLDSFTRLRRRTALTIGNFDGVHLGHRRLANRLLHHAKTRDAIPTVVTFDPHPQEVLRGSSPSKLTSFEQKLALLEAISIRQLVVIRFEKELSLMEPEEFIDQILVRKLRAASVVVGANFRFGHFARGDTAMLRSFGRRLGFATEGVRVVELGGRRVSSTEIRHALAEGDLRWTNRALGRPYALSGKVIKGKNRGRRLMGFPTANLKVPADICLPATGIYAGRLLLDGNTLGAAISVGTNPTFGRNPLSIEAFILDFDGDLYGRDTTLEFLEHLRPERTYPDPAELAQAIAVDVDRTRRVLARAKPPGKANLRGNRYSQ